MKFSRLRWLAIGLSMMVMSLMVTSVFAISLAEKSPTEPRTHLKPTHLSSESIVIAGFHSDRGGALSLPQGDFFADARLAISSNYPAVSFTAFLTLTAAAVQGVDLLVLSSGTGAQSAIPPLTAVEQDVLAAYVTAGGCALLLPDNDSFAPTAPQANASLLDPFGLAINGIIQNQVTAVVTNPANHPITNGPHGMISAIFQGWPGGLTNLGPFAVSLATNPLGDALAVIPPGALSSGAGPVIIYADVSAFADDADQGNFSANLALWLNTVDFCLQQPRPSPQSYLPVILR